MNTIFLICISHTEDIKSIKCDNVENHFFIDILNSNLEKYLIPN